MSRSNQAQDAAVIAMVDKLREHGSWTGLTHIQKALYFCQVMLRMPLGFDYILYKHGPYSPMLERRIHRLEAESTLAFVPQPPPYRPRIVTSEGAEAIREKEPDVLAASDDAIDFVAAAVGKRTIEELERLATALWFIIHTPDATSAELAASVHGVKPHISLEQAIRAFQEVRRLGRAARQKGLIRSPQSPSSRTGPKRAATEPQPLIIDTASAGHTLRSDEFAFWAQARSVFVSSEMDELGSHRTAVADALRSLGLRASLFEDAGGLDDSAQQAYLDGVAQSDIYVGIVADRYGTMLPSGRSPTHEEYREARLLGKRISFWVAEDDQNRQGNAVDFVDEVRAFHTTGRFADADDLCRRLTGRVRQLAAEDESPWIKIGNICFRTTSIRDRADELLVTAEVRDVEVGRALEDLRAQSGDGIAVRVSTFERAGELRNIAVDTTLRSISVREMEIRAEVVWTSGPPASAGPSAQGYTPNDLIELDIRAGLLGEAPPSSLERPGIVDPLRPIAGRALSHSAQQAVAALILSDWLLGEKRASRIDRFALGPPHQGMQRLTLVYTEPTESARTSGVRHIEGVRDQL